MFKKFKYSKKAQTLLEFVVLFIVIITALLTMQHYLRRGIQGKWHDSLDGMADQYDPAANMQTTYTMTSNASTEINVVNGQGGYSTWRTDITNTIEDKVENIQINGI